MPAKRPAPGSAASTDQASPPERPRKKIVACRKCHAQKVKCSGEQPCTKCRKAGLHGECEYEARDHKVTVKQSYIDQLVAENRRLREEETPAPKAPTDDDEASPPRVQEDMVNTEQSSRNPFLGDRAWFHPYDPAAIPIYIGEAACTAFATRFRRFLTGNNATPHITRTQYVDESVLLEAGKAEVSWPPLSQAQLLVKVAFKQVSRVYHMMLRRSTLAALKEIYRTKNFDCVINKCKFFTLFAFGEVYSIRSSSSGLPGMAYYARAIGLIQILPERPSIPDVENLLLLSLFSYFLNRRRYAFTLVGNAMRLGLTIGLNHNIPETHLINPIEREHRVRIWWTIYIFDRMWASKMGLPVSILDEDIFVDTPSNIFPQQEHDEEFSDTEYLMASIDLARIAGETITKIYSRKKYKKTFLQRVQELLKALKIWVGKLPEHIKLNSQELGLTPKHIISLHLSFNQCVILATRPTLLHVLIELSKKESEIVSDTRRVVSQASYTLSEACIHAAQHSHALIIERWISGSLPVLGYFYAQYLFSASLVLAMSSLIYLENASNDMEALETSAQVLHYMSSNGNLAATEFLQNLAEVKQCLDSYLNQRSMRLGSGSENHTIIPETEVNVVSATAFAPQVMENSFPPSSRIGMNLSTKNTSGAFTTEMAFLEPTMQAFLEQSDFDLGILNPADISANEASSSYFWPTPQ